MNEPSVKHASSKYNVILKTECSSNINLWGQDIFDIFKQKCLNVFNGRNGIYIIDISYTFSNDSIKIDIELGFNNYSVYSNLYISNSLNNILEEIYKNVN